MMAKAKAMGGKYEMTTANGDTLSAEVKDGTLYMVDGAGGRRQGHDGRCRPIEWRHSRRQQVLLPK
jgi:hypothetical protein